MTVEGYNGKITLTDLPTMKSFHPNFKGRFYDIDGVRRNMTFAPVAERQIILNDALTEGYEPEALEYEENSEGLIFRGKYLYKWNGDKKRLKKD